MNAKMNMTTERPQPPVLKREGFQLVDECFSIPGVERVSADRLKELFDPQALPLKRDQIEAEAEAKKLFKKAFFAGQLRYYGIKFPSSATVARLEAQLRDAVQQGMCERVPKAVTSLEMEMRRDYEPDLRRWQDAARAWDAELDKKLDEAFARCETPAQQAACDVPRFLERYFLTEGEPDRDKTPEPMALHGYDGRFALDRHITKIPDLCISRGGAWPRQTVCIGWGRLKVYALGRELTAEVERAQKQKMEAMWEEAMGHHRELVSRTGRLGAERQTAPKPFDLDQCVGSYIVQCESITDEWPDQMTKVLTLDIAKRTQNGADIAVAAVNWEIFEGTMLLSHRQETLAGLFSESERSSDEDDDEDVDEDDDERDDDEGDGSASGAPSKRAAPSSLPAGSQPPRKMQKVDGGDVDVPLRRAYLGLRGRETGEGEIYPDPEPGHIDFQDEACTSFVGVAGISFIGRALNFRGFKVSDTPAKEPEAWQSFDGPCYGNWW